MRADVQEWLELRNKEIKLTFKQSELSFLEIALSNVMADYLSNKKLSHEDKMSAVAYARALRNKVSAHIVRQTETPLGVSKRRALADEVRELGSNK